jgi:hypothetical protein
MQVRHEAAEALGSVSSTHGCEDQVLPMLEQYVKPGAAAVDSAVSAIETAIVRESCEVALDIHEYWTDAHQFGGDEQFAAAVTVSNTA